MVIQIWPRSHAQRPTGSRLDAMRSVAKTWHANTLPLGATEALTASVAEVLHYDDVVYYVFQTPRGPVSVYAAYWQPEKMPTQLVAAHTPDRCLTEAGWRCLALDYQATSRVGDVTLRPGQGRTFVPGGGATSGHRLGVNGPSPTSPRATYVLYWHLVGSELYDYGARFNDEPSAWRWCRDAARQILRPPQEQYFIRLASEVPFGELKHEPAFVAIVAGLGRLGLRVED